MFDDLETKFVSFTCSRMSSVADHLNTFENVITYKIFRNEKSNRYEVLLEVLIDEGEI